MTEGAVALPDVNVLVALSNPSHAHHDVAHTWFVNIDRFATTPVTESGLLRLLTNPTVMGQSVSLTTAVDVLATIRQDPRASFISDDSTLALPHISLVGLIAHRQMTDFHLLNLAARHGAVLTSFDRKLVASLVARDRKHVALIG